MPLMGCFRVGAAINASLNVDQEVRFILCPSRDADKLRRELSEIKDLKEATESRVKELQGEPLKQIRDDVLKWLKEVDRVDGEVRQILAKLSGGGFTLRRFCCCVCQNYTRGEDVHNKLERVLQLKSQHNGWGGQLAIDIRHVESVVEGLRKDVQQLLALRSDTEREVERTKMEQPVEMSKSVENWKKEVDEIEAEAKEVTEAQIQTGGIARLRGRVDKLTKQRQEWKSPDQLVVLAGPERVEEILWPPPPCVVGTVDNMIAEILVFLQRDEGQLLGIHGKGGVGKTTLMGELNRRLKHNSSPYLVICVEAGRSADIFRIQGDVGRRLGYRSGGDAGPRLPAEVSERAKLLLRCISNKKNCLLILDDVHERMDLHMIGVAIHRRPESGSRCKVVLTTREERVCADMGVHQKLRLDLLDGSESWRLFRGTIWPDNLLEQEAIRSLAEKAVGMCGGLPSVIVTVARAMSMRESLREWRVAGDVLLAFSAEIQGSGAGLDDLLPRLAEKLALTSGEDPLLLSQEEPSDAHLARPPPPSPRSAVSAADVASHSGSNDGTEEAVVAHTEEEAVTAEDEPDPEDGEGTVTSILHLSVEIMPGIVIPIPIPINIPIKSPEG